MKKHTLCIVDMQPGAFTAAQDCKTRLEVIKLVEEAKTHGAGVVILEYSGCSPTDPIIIQALHGYKRKIIAKKQNNDGSAEFLSACKRRRFNRSHIRVCGVYTDFCVQETIEGLNKKLPKSTIEVVAEACNGEEHEGALEEMGQLKGVKVVR